MKDLCFESTTSLSEWLGPRGRREPLHWHKEPSSRLRRGQLDEVLWVNAPHHEDLLSEETGALRQELSRPVPSSEDVQRSPPSWSRCGRADRPYRRLAYWRQEHRELTAPSPQWKDKSKITSTRDCLERPLQRTLHNERSSDARSTRAAHAHGIIRNASPRSDSLDFPSYNFEDYLLLHDIEDAKSKTSW